MPRFLPLSTLMLAAAFMTGCASTPALHVIGVYQGSTPAGVDNQPWWAKCNDIQSMQQRHPSGTCYAEHANAHPEHEIVVNVSDASRPLVLAFIAYEPMHWQVVPLEQVQIARVILAGYYSQRVTGLPPGTPVESYRYYPTPCDHCWRSSLSFYNHERPPAQLKEVTGLEVTSFQGRYQGTEFSIFPGMRTWP